MQAAMAWRFASAPTEAAELPLLRHLTAAEQPLLRQLSGLTMILRHNRSGGPPVRVPVCVLIAVSMT